MARNLLNGHEAGNFSRLPEAVTRPSQAFGTLHTLLFDVVGRASRGVDARGTVQGEPV